MPKKLRSTPRKQKVNRADTKGKSLNPAAEKGSLKELFDGKTSKEIIEKARIEERKEDAKWLER
jgi:hypothetical protein